MIKAGTGIVTPALIETFQVSVTPADADLGREMGLTRATELAATDTFTSEKRDEKLEAFTTGLTQDPLTTPQDWQVVR